MRPLRYILSWLYGSVVAVRNLLYDKHILKSYSVDIPTISVGNLAVGGTGKTPHTIYIANMLSERGLNVAVLLRGYKRHTRGFVLASESSTAGEIGDEAKLISQRCLGVKVAVCADRIEGIRRLCELDKKLEVVVLDDCMQYRRLRVGLSLLLTAADNLYCSDHYLPYGRLRDLRSRDKSADMVIVSGMPANCAPKEKQTVLQPLNERLGSLSRVFTSEIKYLPLQPLWSNCSDSQTAVENNKVVILTAIARPETMVKKLREQYPKAVHVQFADHHEFSENDFRKLDGADMVITTEKDAMRLKDNPNYPEQLKCRTFMQPINVGIQEDKKEMFNQIIYSYVTENNSDRRLSAR